MYRNKILETRCHLLNTIDWHQIYSFCQDEIGVRTNTVSPSPNVEIIAQCFISRRNTSDALLQPNSCVQFERLHDGPREKKTLWRTHAECDVKLACIRCQYTTAESRQWQTAANFQACSFVADADAMFCMFSLKNSRYFAPPKYCRSFQHAFIRNEYTSPAFSMEFKNSKNQPTEMTSFNYYQ